MNIYPYTPIATPLDVDYGIHQSAVSRHSLRRRSRNYGKPASQP